MKDLEEIVSQLRVRPASLKRMVWSKMKMIERRIGYGKQLTIERNWQVLKQGVALHKNLGGEPCVDG